MVPDNHGVSAISKIMGKNNPSLQLLISGIWSQEEKMININSSPSILIFLNSFSRNYGSFFESIKV